MHIGFKRFCILFIFTALLFHGLAVSAQENEGYRNWNTYHRQTVSFTQKDKNSIIRYYQLYCTAKNTRKTQDCVSTTKTRKYTLGTPLARNTKVRNLPNELISRLSALPRGYEYLKLDRDVLIVSTRSGKVMDAVATGGSIASASLLPVVNSYVVYFNPDTAALRSGESRILNQIAREMAQYVPTQVTVTSYADSVIGTSSETPLTDDRINMVLNALNAFGMNIPNSNQVTSQNPNILKQLSTIARRQAEAVSKELSNRNISNKIITSSVRGSLESDLMEDDAGEEVTQMVVIDFRR